MCGDYRIKIFAIALIVALGSPALGVSAQAPRYGGTFIQAIGADPPHLNPAITSEVWSLITTGAIFDTLVNYDFEQHPVPQLAQSWEISKDGLSYKFNLVRNATWHDGKPVTSQDVKFTFEEVLKKYHPRARTGLINLDSVQTPDDYTVIFKFKRVYAPFIFILGPHNGPILPKHIYNGTDVLKNPANWQPVGSGPFKFVEWVKGDHITLEKNPNYWKKGLPYLDRIISKIYRDASSMVIAFQKGEVDYIPGYSFPRSEASTLKNDPNVVETIRGEEGLLPILMNLYNIHRKPLDDYAVRKAIAMAIDRQFILDKAFYGIGRIATGPISSDLKWAYTSDVTQYPFDSDAANKLLDGAGYARGPDGNRFTLTLVYDLRIPPSAKSAEIVAEQLTKIGIKVDLRPLDTAAYLDRVFVKRDFDLSVQRFITGPDPDVGVGRLYTSWSIQPVPYSNGAVAYNNSRVDALFKEGSNTVDLEQRAKAYREVQKVLTAEIPYFWLIEVPDLAVYKKDFMNVHGWSAESRLVRGDIWWVKGELRGAQAGPTPFVDNTTLAIGAIVIIAIAIMALRKRKPKAKEARAEKREEKG